MKDNNSEYNNRLLEEKLDTILEKSKYLYLAHYLEKNRGDWSSGYNYARVGINGFGVESELDGMIWEEIEGLIFGVGWRWQMF